MAMPETLVMVRHGLSEPNIVQQIERHVANGNVVIDEATGDYEVRDPSIEDFVTKYIHVHAMRDEVYARPDWLQRLSYEGEKQAQIAGAWLTKHFIAPEDFDELYVSPFNRTLDTARCLGGENSNWLADIRVVERDWGAYGATPRDQRPDKFPHTEKMKDESSFFVRYDNGQSIFDKVFDVRDWLDTLDRDHGDKKVLVVCHGETMWATRFVIERLLPHEFQAMDTDKSLRLGNCSIVIYDKKNPFDQEEKASSLSSGWLRIVDPVEPEKSPYGGEWQRLAGKRRFNGVQLGQIAAATPRLLPPAE